MAWVLWDILYEKINNNGNIISLKKSGILYIKSSSLSVSKLFNLAYLRRKKRLLIILRKKMAALLNFKAFWIID